MLCGKEARGLSNIAYLELSEKFTNAFKMQLEAGMFASGMFKEGIKCSVEAGLYGAGVPFSPRRAGWLLNVGLTKGGYFADDVVIHLGRGVLIEKDTDNNPTINVFETQPLPREYLKEFELEGFRLVKYSNNVAYYVNPDDNLGYTLLFLKDYPERFYDMDKPLIPHPHGVVIGGGNVIWKDVENMIRKVEKNIPSILADLRSKWDVPEVPYVRPAVTWLMLKQFLSESSGELFERGVVMLDYVEFPQMLEALLYTMWYGDFYNYSNEEFSPVVLSGDFGRIDDLKFVTLNVDVKGESTTGVLKYEEGVVVYELINQFSNLTILAGDEVIRAYEEDRGVKLPQPTVGNGVAMLPCGALVEEAWVVEVTEESDGVLGVVIGRDRIKKAKELVKKKELIDAGINVLVFEGNEKPEYVDLMIH